MFSQIYYCLKNCKRELNCTNVEIPQQPENRYYQSYYSKEFTLNENSTLTIYAQFIEYE